MPANHQSKIPIFDGTPQSISAQYHILRMTDILDLHEIDAENVSMRLFAQTFGGEVRKWFRALQARSINTLQELQTLFLDQWEMKKDLLQITSEYTNIKHNPGESVQDYIIRFNAVYNAIPDDLRPSKKSSLLKFSDGFDLEMAYSLRDRDLSTLEDMQKISVSVEANLNDKREQLKAEKRVTIKEGSTSEPPWLREMEKMFKRMNLDKSETQIRNPNYRGQQQPQFRIKQREQRVQEPAAQQQIKTPLLQNFGSQDSDDDADVVGDQNHFFTPDDMPIYITEDEEYGERSVAQKDEDFILANDADLDDYQRGYLNALSTQQKQYSLRN